MSSSVSSLGTDNTRSSAPVHISLVVCLEGSGKQKL